MTRSGSRIRIAVGAVISAAAIAGVALAVPASWPTSHRSALSVTADPEPSTSLLACGGGVLAIGRDAADVSALASAAAQRLTVGVTPGAPAPEVADIAPADVPGAPAAGSFAAEPIDRERTDLAAAGSATVDDADLAGFAAAACTPPTMESWLAAGSGLTGAADLVVLANPGDVASRVELTVFGAAGQVAPDAGSGVLVPPRSQRVVPLAALALGEQSPVVLVTATQAPVQATLQSSLTRTLVPGGIDQSVPTALPAARQEIPSFTVVGGDSTADTLVRVLAPSDAATATVTVTSIDSGEQVYRTDPLTLEAGIPLEVDVATLPAGRYSATVEADAPVVAALWAATGVGEGSDFAWYATTESIDVPSLLAVAAGPDPRLAVVADPDADRTIVLTEDAGAGTSREITVPAGDAVSVALDGGATYRLDPGESGVHANVTFAGSGALASYPVVPADAAAAPVVVRPR